MVFQEQHLSVAAQTNDLMAKTLAYGSLGRTHHALLNYAQAVMYLQEGEAPENTLRISLHSGSNVIIYGRHALI